MAHDHAQPATIAVLERGEQLRSAFGRPGVLRAESERLLDAVPEGCDLLASSPDAYAIALVACALADLRGRELIVHRASHLPPHAPPLRSGRWTWVSAEALLGLGPPRAWVRDWAAARGGTPHREPALALVG